MVAMENVIVNMTAEVKDGMTHIVLWRSDKSLPTIIDIQRGNVEDIRPFLDKMGELLGLELTAKEKK